MTKTGQLMLCGPIDREKTEKHILGLGIFSDGYLRSRAKVEIIVLDVNDNPPEIPLGNRVTWVRENVKNGAKILKLKPYDKDMQKNTTYFYRIVDKDMEKV